jgi:RNA polymerase sigma-70 factor (ECF subfamily)
VTAHEPMTRESIEVELERYRQELTGYCYRMLGSGFEAEDAVQETMLRAWKGIDSFEGRSALRSWLYRIATNVCLDMVGGPQRRARPMDLGPASPAESALAPASSTIEWIQPIADDRVLPEHGDPGEMAAARETIRLAFVAALQHLPARQRAVLILREVLKWRAAEVAELLDTSVASVNSALQRARATLATVDPDARARTAVDPDQRELLARYVAAFEAYDISSLVALLRDDVKFSMPPYEMWVEGPVEVSKFLLGTGIGCKDSRLIATRASGSPAFGSYKPAGPGVHEPWALQVLEISGGRIVEWYNFLYPEAFPAFGLPTRLES